MCDGRVGLGCVRGTGGSALREVNLRVWERGGVHNSGCLVRMKMRLGGAMRARVLERCGGWETDGRNCRRLERR